MRQLKESFSLCLMGLSLAACLTGCDGAPAGPKTVPVSGVVSYNGAPVKAGTLYFAPGDDKVARATQAAIVDGKYTTEEGQGLMVGKYKVTISALAKPVTEMDPKDAPKGTNLYAVPKKYMDLKTTDLEVTVSATDSSVTKDFPLVD